MNTIPLETPLVCHLRAGGKPYQPVVADLTLLVENGSYRHSLDNLSQLVAANNRVVGFVAGLSGVVVLFANGLQYLATGFSVGRTVYRNGRDEAHETVAAFAQFAVDAIGVGTFEAWKSALSALPVDYCGEVVWDDLDDLDDEGFHELRPYLPLDDEE